MSPHRPAPTEPPPSSPVAHSARDRTTPTRLRHLPLTDVRSPSCQADRETTTPRGESALRPSTISPRATTSRQGAPNPRTAQPSNGTRIKLGYNGFHGSARNDRKIRRAREPFHQAPDQSGQDSTAPGQRAEEQGRRPSGERQCRRQANSLPRPADRNCAEGTDASEPRGHRARAVDDRRAVAAGGTGDGRVPTAEPAFGTSRRPASEAHHVPVGGPASRARVTRGTDGSRTPRHGARLERLDTPPGPTRLRSDTVPTPCTHICHVQQPSPVS